jgi:Ca2+-transporting ATPase
VAQLKGCRRTAYRLETALAAVPEVRRVEARPLTGTLIIEYLPELGLTDIFRIIAVALRASANPAPAERPAPESLPRSRKRPKPSPDNPERVLDSDDIDFHTLSVGDVVARLRSDSRRGLTTVDARARLAREGANSLPPPQPRSEFAVVLEQLTSLPVALLCASAAVSIGTGGLADAVAIMGVVAANAAIGYLTESHAERVIASLEDGDPPPARVLRDEVAREVSTEEVVRGDLLQLEPGGYVAGDARIVTGDGLLVDESSLTGESFPVRKHADPLPKAGVPLADRRNIAFRGTTVTSGSGSALVFAIGAATEVGRLGASTPKAPRALRPPTIRHAAGSTLLRCRDCRSRSSISQTRRDREWRSGSGTATSSQRCCSTALATSRRNGCWELTRRSFRQRAQD